MAHNTSNQHEVFDQVQANMVLENPAQLCLYAATNTNVYVEVWDSGHGTLQFRPNNGSAPVGAIALVVGPTAVSLAYLASLTYESASLPLLQAQPSFTGIPDGSAGGFLLVDPNGSTVYYNVAGTSDGSAGAGNGIAVGRAGPSVFSPRQLPPGATLKFGGFIE